MKTYIVDFKTKFGKDFTCVDAENEFDAVKQFYLKVAYGIANDPWVVNRKGDENWYELALKNHDVIKVTAREDD